MSELQQAIEKIDQVSAVAILVDSIAGSPLASADATAIAVGHKPIGDRWHLLAPREIETLLAWHIGHDLAYVKPVLMPIEECQQIALSILRLADANVTWYTNHDATLKCLSSGGAYSFTPTSEWTFDAAYAAVGQFRTLYICFMAED